VSEHITKTTKRSIFKTRATKLLHNKPQSRSGLAARSCARPSVRHKPRPWPNKFTHRRIIRYR